LYNNVISCMLNPYIIKKYRSSSNLVMVRWFLTRVMPLYEIISFRSLSPQRYYTFNSNLTYGYVKGMRRSSLNLVMVQWFYCRVMPLSLWKQYEIFSFRSLSPQWLYIFNSNLTYGYVIRIHWSSLNLVIVWW
jgi:hypothetical protein